MPDTRSKTVGAGSDGVDSDAGASGSRGEQTPDSNDLSAEVTL